MATVEVRCPVGPRRLFSKLMLSGGTPHITDDNLMEFACADCRKLYARLGTPVQQIFHRYNLVGELIETQVVYPDGATEIIRPE